MKKRNLAPNYPVPANAQDAAAMIAEIGTLQREIIRRDQDYKDEAAALKEKHDADTLPLKEQSMSLEQGVILWATNNRDLLTEGGRRKTVSLPTGDIAWRNLPPSVKLKHLDQIIAYAKANGLLQFVRQSEAVNKEAMLADKETARTIPGVTIGSDGEEIVISPHFVEREAA